MYNVFYVFDMSLQKNVKGHVFLILKKKTYSRTMIH